MQSNTDSERREEAPQTQRNAAGPGCATVLLLIVPFVIAWNVLTIAQGSYQFDSARPATSVLLIWLIAVIVAIAAIWTVRSRGFRSLSGGFTMGATVALIVVAVAVTASKTRNDAPDGSDFDVTLSEAEATAVQEATDALNGIAGEGWTEQNGAGFLRRKDTCLDVFGAAEGRSLPPDTG